jgi:hypothetical protein
MGTIFNSDDAKASRDPMPEARKRRVPGRGKDKVWIGPDFEFTEAEIEELFEAPLFPPDEAP